MARGRVSHQTLLKNSSSRLTPEKFRFTLLVALWSRTTEKHSLNQISTARTYAKGQILWCVSPSKIYRPLDIDMQHNPIFAQDAGVNDEITGSPLSKIYVVLLMVWWA